ncbi:microtubule organization protein AKNA isoform X2 [Cheilinus undulatus]|uniref:microtubule organization protein AKNA isoform X2 n=1 Tax=Cheilinus undulatus TaxID=241271 RepID=UPI001BD35B0E|nr:microtubule organization protein AKNA isoform X2 [Cheilinus undulatus]
METRKNTTAGVLFWTPAPARTSTPSSVISEEELEGEEEEQAQRDDDDFASQMDDNGIIGLSEALEDMELRRTFVDMDINCNANLGPGPLKPEEEDPSEDDGELSGNRRDLSCHDFMDTQTVYDQMLQRKDKQGMEFLHPSDKYLDMSEEESSSKKAGNKSDRKRNKNETGTKNSSTESHTSKRETVKISSTQSCSDHLTDLETCGVSNHHCPVPQPASSATLPVSPHVLHFTAEKITAAGIEAETLPDMSSIESCHESPRSHTSLKFSPQCPEIKLKASFEPTAMLPEVAVLDGHNKGTDEPSKGLKKLDKHHKQPKPSPRKTTKLSPEATYCRTRGLGSDRADSVRQTTNSNRELRASRTRSGAAKVDESRKEPLSYRMPDFSKVEPRVRFPKSGYTPPKSRRSFKRESLSPEPLVVFKSPAEIVKEVFLNTSDGSPEMSGSHQTPNSAPISIVPQGFRSPQQATTMMEELQEHYKRLLTKHAEAERTIDRLRLEAKVNLYSDPPKPGHLVQSGLNREASKVMILDFPQAQRADINLVSLHSNGASCHQRSPPACPSTCSPGPQFGQQLANILYGQADKFLQQLQIFDDLLKNNQLKHDERMKGVLQLAKGLDFLERGYLSARDEHKVMLQQGAEMGPFDPDRELEGFVFQCGLSMEEIKEQVEQMQEEEPVCETSPTLQPDLTSSSVSSDGGEALTQPESPAEPSLAHLVQPSVSERSAANKEDYLRPLEEQAFAKPVDHCQSFKELPKLIAQDHKDGASLFATGTTNLEPIMKEKGTQNQEMGNLEVKKSLPQRQSIHQESSPICSTKQLRSSLPSVRDSSQSFSPPVPPPPGSRKSIEMGRSHSSSLSSLGEIAAPERRITKLQTGISRVLSQDGIISPEMDSGFVGSESSRLTPAAGPSPLHQRASESVSVHQEGNSEKPHTGPLTAPPPASSQLHRQTAVESSRGSQLNHDRQRRGKQRQRRRMISCSPQRQIFLSEQSSGTSEFALESESSVSEDRRDVHYPEYINSLHSNSSSSSPTARHHHGNSLRKAGNHNAAIQTLQAEVSRLRATLERESCSKSQKSTSSHRVVPAAQENHTHINISTTQARSSERGSFVTPGRRDRHSNDEFEDSVMRRSTRTRPTSAQRQKTHPGVCTKPPTPEPQPLVSRSTQTSAAARESQTSHMSIAHSSTQTKQHPSMSETTDEPDSRSRKAPLCPQCFSHHRGHPDTAGSREPAHSSHCQHCRLCGCSEPNSSSEPDHRRVSIATKHSACQPAQPHPAGVSSSCFTAAAPSLPLHCMPVCPPPPSLLFYSLPLCVPPTNSSGKSSGLRGQGEVRVRRRRSLSADRQLCLESSLNRANRAAQHMKDTSGRMARSLALGLHYQELLRASCNY